MARQFLGMPGSEVPGSERQGCHRLPLAETGVLGMAGAQMPVADVHFLSLDTFSAIGKEVSVLDGYREAELLGEAGPGCLTRLWFGGDWLAYDWPAYEKTRLRVYVDGETRPSINMNMAVGLGHGYGFGDGAAPWGTERMGKTGHPSGVYNTYEIPFGTSIRVTAQRSEEGPAEAAFWWIVRGTKNLPVTYAGVRLPPEARLRLHTCECLVSQPLEELRPVRRRGLERHQLFRGHRPRLPERSGGAAAAVVRAGRPLPGHLLLQPGAVRQPTGGPDPPRIQRRTPSRRIAFTTTPSSSATASASPVGAARS